MPSAWSALADPNRRAVLELLLERPRAVGELVERLELSQPNTSKHLRVLREAGLVRVDQDAQRRVYALEPGTLAELDAWLAPYRKLWDRRLDALERHLDKTDPQGDLAMPATYETLDGRPTLRFERRIAHPVEKVWRAVTDPAELAHWFPAGVSVDDLAVGAPLTFAYPDGEMPPTSGEVTEVDPPHRFAFDWGDDRLRFDLEPLDGGCLLRFTVELDASDRAARDSAGWDVCLDVLERRLAGADVEAPDSSPTATWRERYEHYIGRGFPSGAPIPGE